MDALSRREEDALIKATKARALKECDPVVKAFADCAEGRTITVAWACKEKYKAVQECMLEFTGAGPMSVARQEYLRLRNEQQASQRPS
ncbi:hypothetical protein BC835DRAFT_1411054 [Cytidiella melzeri]|nr:hypothetical protein BC835DRAFT_1411054 [Cytidiella melzeri]